MSPSSLPGSKDSPPINKGEDVITTRSSLTFRALHLSTMTDSNVRLSSQHRQQQYDLRNSHVKYDYYVGINV